MKECNFCKFYGQAAAQPYNVIYEGEKVLAFLDIAPITPGHTLVIPREHIQHLRDAPQALIQEITDVIQKISSHVVSAVSAEGFNVGLNDDSVAGQVIPHMHWHIIPRSTGDGLSSWPNQKTSEEALRSVAESIKKRLV